MKKKKKFSPRSPLQEWALKRGQFRRMVRGAIGTIKHEVLWNKHLTAKEIRMCKDCIYMLAFIDGNAWKLNHSISRKAVNANE